MTSIRRILLVRLFGGAFALFLVGALLLQIGVGWLLREQFDTTLRTKLATFTTLIEQEGYEIELSFVEQSMPEYYSTTEPDYLEIWLFDGSPLYRSPSLGDEHLPRLVGTEAEPAIQDLTLLDGRAGRSIGAEFPIHHYEPGAEDPGPARVGLVLTMARGPLDRALATLLVGTLGGIVLLMVAGFFLGRAAVRRGLGPLEDLTRHVSAIQDPSRAPRFSTVAVPDELVPLARNHNELLDRIARAFERERRTTANIAHELRTPVAELAILTDAAERYADDLEETARTLSELREISVQMSSLISTLVELARMESGRVPLEIEEIDLVEMLRSCWDSVSAASADKGLRFRLPEGDGPQVLADRVALSILLSNLLSNAVDHAPAGDEVGCTIEDGDEREFLAITNSANGLDPEDIEKLTEPFWRASPAREDQPHAGLGLSLVARLAALLDFELAFSLDDGLFRARLGFHRAGGSS